MMHQYIKMYVQVEEKDKIEKYSFRYDLLVSLLAYYIYCKMDFYIRYTFWPLTKPSNNEIHRDNKISIKVWCTSISITIISLIQLNIRVDLSSMNERFTDGIASTKIPLTSTNQNARMIRINKSVVGCWVCWRKWVRDTRNIFFLIWFSMKML